MGWRVRINPSYDWAKEGIDLGISHRELEVFALGAEGFNNKEIGEILDIKYQSVKNHMHSVGKKLRAKNMTQAVVIAIHLNLISVEGRAGSITIKMDEASYLEGARRLIDGETGAPAISEKKRREIRLFFRKHGMDIYAEKKSGLESEVGSSREQMIESKQEPPERTSST